MQQNYLIYNRQTSDPRKLIIGCQSLEIELLSHNFGNRYLEIDLRTSLFANGRSIFGNQYSENDIRKSILANRSSEIDIRKLIFAKRSLEIDIQKLIFANLSSEIGTRKSRSKP